jgi:hypothetical protein
VIDLFATGRIVDLILALMVLEAAGLTVYRRASGRGIPVPDLLCTLLAGVGLLLALREALVGSSWAWIALWLCIALLAHLADIGRRWRP